MVVQEMEEIQAVRVEREELVGDQRMEGPPQSSFKLFVCLQGVPPCCPWVEVVVRRVSRVRSAAQGATKTPIEMRESQIVTNEIEVA